MAVVGEFEDLCRLCATKTGILMGLPIFEARGRMRDIEKKIVACLPVQVSLSDQLPKVVCEECAYKLDQLFDFREKCMHTEGMFIEMLKEIGKSEVVQISHNLQDVEELPAGIEGIQGNIDMMQGDLEEIQGDMSGIQDNMDEIGSNIGGMQNIRSRIQRDMDVMQEQHNETVQADMQTMQVMDEMDLAGGEQVVSQEEIGPQEGDIEVTAIDCLDGDTVRMVDEHMREVANHQITMHLEGDMTVVSNLTVGNHLSQLDINYVTSVDPPSQNRGQIVHYCENVKYEPVPVKEEYQRFQERLSAEGTTTHAVENNVVNETFPESNTETESEVEESGASENEAHDNVDPLQISVVEPSTSQRTSENTGLMVEYTKGGKLSLLNTTLSNPTVDETGINWYVCPFCNEAATEPNSLAVHFEQHFCRCPCGLHFTSVEALNLHKAQCTANKSKRPSKEKKSTSAPQPEAATERITSEEVKKQPAVRQKWTPKICAQCGKQYRTNYKLQEHMRKHTGEKPFQCLLCEKAFRSKIGLAQHTATHTGQFDYNCSTCGKGFQCKSYLIVHQRVHSDLKPYPCSTCGQNFKTKQSLLDHQNRHLGFKPYLCEICGRGFITKGLCKSHQKIHSGMDNRQYPCIVCNKMFVSKSYLNTHLRIHTGEKPYPCEVCGKGFLTRVDLKIHSTMHTGDKNFVCDVCGKAFARRAVLRCHRRSHTGERPYGCDVCGKTFTQFSPMAIHKRLHTGERPYGCDVCGKAFVSKSTMMCHRKKHHLTTPVEQKDINPVETKTIIPSEIVLRESHEGLQITAD